MPNHSALYAQLFALSLGVTRVKLNLNKLIIFLVPYFNFFNQGNKILLAVRLKTQGKRALQHWRRGHGSIGLLDAVVGGCRMYTF